MRAIVVIDVFLVDGETDRITVTLEGRKLRLQPRPDLRDRRVVRIVARQFGHPRALAQSGEESDREAVHFGFAKGFARSTRWPISGRINFSMARRHPPVEPGSAARSFPL